MLMLKFAAALVLLLGSGLIFKALVEMDAPSFRPGPRLRRPQPHPTSGEDAPASLRRAA